MATYGETVLNLTLARTYVGKLPANVRSLLSLENEIAQFLGDPWGLSFAGNPTASNCSPNLLDARGKETMAEGLPARNGEPARPSVESTFGCTPHGVAAQFESAEVPEDVCNLLGEIQQMCQPV